MHRFLSFSLLLAVAIAIPAQSQTQADRQASGDSLSATAPHVTGYSLPPDKLAKSFALYRTREWLVFVSTIYSFLILIAFIRWRWAAKLRTWAERASSRRFVQALIVVPLFALSFTALRLPLVIYGHHVGLRFGLSVQGWGSWLRDWLVELVLIALVGSIVVWIFYAIVAHSPRHWWFYFWLAIIPISAFLTFVAPVAIEPLFYKYEPLAATRPDLVQALHQVSTRGGLEVPRDRMYAMQASTKLTGPNAYVTGFGATKRVVVWDTAVQQFTAPELMMVFGHEMGHYVLGHVVWLFVVAMAFAFVLLFLTWSVAGRLLRVHGQRWGIRGPDDWASMPVLIFVAFLVAFFAQPLLNAESRRIEHNADIYALEITHGLVRNAAQVDAHAFQVLGENWLEYPYPCRMAVLWDWDHPTIADRIQFALNYDPWSKGRSPRFVRTVSPP
jgi:Zn-dependent protease with chaperone function